MESGYSELPGVPQCSISSESGWQWQEWSQCLNALVTHFPLGHFLVHMPCLIKPDLLSGMSGQPGKGDNNKGIHLASSKPTKRNTGIWI